MRRTRFVTTAAVMVCLLARGTPAAVQIEMVPVGNAGNAADTTGFGAVAYDYRIGKYEVTIGQWAEFLNTVATSDPYGLFNPLMETQLTSAGIARSGVDGSYTYTLLENPAGQSSANRPITYVSFVNAARFANWMSNGQGTASTESGAYTISTGTVVAADLVGGTITYTMSGPTTVSVGDQVAFTGLGTTLNVGGLVTGVLSPTQFTVANSSGDVSVVASGTMVGTSATHAPGAAFWVPTEDEWYKAAYYSATLNSGSGGYYLYATGTNIAPGNALGSAPNQANYSISGVYAVGPTPLDQTKNYLSDVGAFAGSAGIYGTFDMNGNVNEWNSGIMDSLFGSSFGGTGIRRGTRGGSYANGANRLQPSYRDANSPLIGFSTLGFRLAGPASAPPAGITINVGSGTQTQTQAGYPTLSGTLPVLKTGAGTLVLDQANTLTGSTTVQWGRVQLANSAALGSSRLVPLAGGTVTLTPGLQTTVGGLAPSAGGLLDVGSGMVTVAAGLTVPNMVAAIVSGLGDGTWNGTSGITSSVAAASGGDRTVGWLDNGDGSVTFAFAAAGDTNLDWQVDILDAANFLSGGKFDSGDPASWNEGDFTYDGVVDILDAASFLSNGLFDAGPYNAAPGQAGSVAAVPEPVPWAWAFVGAAVAIRRWRRPRG